jgi:NADH-quinone oxidoreductase subunit K
VSLLLPLVVSALLFAIGVYGVLARRNAVLVLMGVELMLNAVNLNLVAFDAYLADVVHAGQVLTLFVIALAAAEIGLGLAIVLMVFRSHRHIDVDRLRDLSDSDAADAAMARDARAEQEATAPAREQRPGAVETDDEVEQVGSRR